MGKIWDANFMMENNSIQRTKIGKVEHFAT